MDTRARVRKVRVWRRLALAIGVVGAVGAAPTIASAETVTYSATITIPVPPASTFAGSAGGDGWALAMTPDAVYNVFHHLSTLQVACHKQVDASKCWATDAKTITDAGGNGFTGSSHPGLFLDQASGKLYIYSTRTSDNTAGVVCVDTTLPADDPNPFCGFTPLSAVGDGGITSIPMQVGSNWYAFNYVSTVAAGGGAGNTANTLLCFSLTTFAACAGQPFAVNFGNTGAFTTGIFPVPATAAIGGKVFVPTDIANGTEIIACFDPATGASCAGSWPITLGFTYASSFGAAFPLLDGAGATIGLCLPTGTDQCFDLTGASVATPAALASVITASTSWNGPAVVIGTRVYYANGSTDTVQCFNYSTGASCSNFPHTLTNSGFTYTVNTDPQRPACLWTNADFGSAQIQNFDAFSGGGCGQGAIRVLSASFVVPGALCAPTSWVSLHVDTPAPGSYTSGAIDFLDSDGNPIAGVSTQPLDANGGVQLAGLPLTSSLPQFLITLNGLAGPLGQVVVTLTWQATYDPSCVQGSVTATPPVSTTTTPTTTEPPATSAPPTVPPTLPVTGSSTTPVSVLAGALVLLGTGLVIASVRRRATG